MQAYEINLYPGRPSDYAADLKAVRQVIKVIPKGGRIDARITLVDMPSDKAALVGLLNGNKPAAKSLKKWRLSVRGRLIEIDINEDEDEAS